MKCHFLYVFWRDGITIKKNKQKKKKGKHEEEKRTGTEDATFMSGAEINFCIAVVEFDVPYACSSVHSTSTNGGKIVKPRVRRGAKSNEQASRDTRFQKT